MFSPLFSVSLGAFMSGMYGGLLHYPLKMYMYDIYKTASTASLLNVALIPGDLKFLWIHFLENINIPFTKIGVKKKLIIFLDLMMALITFGFYYFNIVDIFYFILYLSIFAIIMSLRDSISVGYKMEMFPKDKLPEYAGIISAYYNIGLWVGGSFLVLLTTNWVLCLTNWNIQAMPWLDIFYYCSIFFLFNAILDCFITNSKEYEEDTSISRVNYYQYLFIFAILGAFFYVSINIFSLKTSVMLLFLVAILIFSMTISKNPDTFKIYKDLLMMDKKQLFFLLGFLITYKFGARLIMTNIIHLFKISGLTNTDMFRFRTIAAFITLFNVWLLPYLIRSFSKKNLKILALLIYLLPLTAFALCGYLKISSLIFYICLLERVCRSLLEDVFFLSKADVCGRKYAMTQLTALSCIEKIFSNIVSIGSGFLIDYYSIEFLFIIALLSVIPSLFFAIKLDSPQDTIEI